MTKKVLAVCSSILLFLMVSSGCWDSVELDRRAIISAAAIDLEDKTGRIKVTLHITRPNALARGTDGGGGQQEPVWVVSSAGYSLQDALKSLTTYTGRELFWGDNRILILGKKAAEKGIFPFIDFMIRDEGPRSRMLLLVTEGEAGKILTTRTEGKLERIVGIELERLVRNYTSASRSVLVDLHDVISKFSRGIISPVASRIELVESKMEGDGGEKGSQKEIRVDGAAVFKGDKLAGWLNAPETRGYLWITGDVGRGVILVKPPWKGGGTTPVNLNIRRASGIIKAKMKDGKPVIVIEVSEESELEVLPRGADLDRPGVIQSLERRQATVIKNEIKACLRKAQQEYKSDIFGFGEEVRRQFPAEWKKIEEEWGEIYPHLEVAVQVRAKIRGTGLLVNPVHPE